MREWIIIIVIILIITFGNFITDKYLEGTTNELINELKDLKQKTIEINENDDRLQIKNKMAELEEKWNKTNKMISIVVMHQEINNVEEALTKARTSINYGELKDAIVELETAIFLADNIKEREKVNLKNIF